MTYNLFEILDNDNRVIVIVDKEDQIIITWNYSLSFELWHYLSTHCEWEEKDKFVYHISIPDFESAKDIAMLWLAGKLTLDNREY